MNSDISNVARETAFLHRLPSVLSGRVEALATFELFGFI